MGSLRLHVADSAYAFAEGRGLFAGGACEQRDPEVETLGEYRDAALLGTLLLRIIYLCSPVRLRDRVPVSQHIKKNQKI